MNWVLLELSSYEGKGNPDLSLFIGFETCLTFMSENVH